ncbi:GNAT family N-acetyltransferase [Acidobacteria bacterium AB60]|nr:GNAT family N-acetyltransferase [Acidobacteria bacterium AB60]
MPTLATERLDLRRWRPSDREPFLRLNADPRVMEFFPAPLTPAQTSEMIALIDAHFDRHGLGMWAAELRATGEFLGFIGLNIPTFSAHFTPCVEIGWRLAAEHWGKGLATEGARAALHYGLATLALPEIVAFTVPANRRSRRVMEKLAMTYNPADDFDHPRLPEGHPLRRHVLYRKAASSS